MNTMNTKKQHIVGALLGAVVGIVLAGTKGNQWLLLLSFPLALNGYILAKDDFIINFFYKSLQRSFLWWKRFLRTGDLISDKSSKLSEKIVDKAISIKRFISRWCSCLVKAFSWLGSLPKKLYVWLKSKPLNQAKFATVSMAVSVAIAGFIAVFFFSKYLLPDKFVSNSAVSVNVSWMLISALLWVVSVLTPILIFMGKRIDDFGRRKYRVKKAIRRKGLFNWIAADVNLLLKVELAYLYMIATGLVYFIFVGGAIVVFLFLPVVVFIATIHMVYSVSVKHGVWTCAVVTTAVTTIAGLVFWDAIVADFTARWLIALATGSLAGFISWQVSQLVERISRIPLMEKLLDDNMDFFDGTWIITGSLAGRFPRGAEAIWAPARVVID